MFEIMKGKVFTVIIFAIAIVHADAQNAQYDPHAIKEKVRSPQVADMMRFDKAGGVSKASGRLDMSIELARIKDRDFDMPVSISYNSAGFMPSKPESCVGLNWSLNVGGAIVREVKGVPDDIKALRQIKSGWVSGSNRYDYSTWYGFNYFIEKKGVFKKNIDLTYVINGVYLPFPVFLLGTYSADNEMDLSSGGYVEASSDIYHFNFGPHSGKFIMNFDGSVSVISNTGGKYKVDLSGYKYADFAKGELNSVIKIITDNGYIYSFGGSFDNVEYSYSWSDNISVVGGLRAGIYNLTANSSPQSYISSFHLYKVEAPNGRTLDIKYRTIASTMHKWDGNPDSFRGYLWRAKESDPSRYEDYPGNLKEVRQNYIGSWHPNCRELVIFAQRKVTMPFTSWLDDLSISPIVDNKPIHNLTKVALIEKISTDSESIEFSYVDSTYSPFDALRIQDIKFEKDAGAQLSVVTKYTGNNWLVSTSDFSYEQWRGETGSRRMLKSVRVHAVGKYEFEYNTSESLPSPLTMNVDFWNYWRGHFYDTSIEKEQWLIPRYYKKNNELFYGRRNDNGIDFVEDRVTTRTPGDYGADLGMLKQVTFPTGGSMKIEYESNEYSRFIKRTADSQFKPVLIDNHLGRKAGGMRVKKIRRNDMVTTYLYQNGIMEDISTLWRI